MKRAARKSGPFHCVTKEAEILLSDNPSYDDGRSENSCPQRRVLIYKDHIRIQDRIGPSGTKVFCPRSMYMNTRGGGFVAALTLALMISGQAKSSVQTRSSTPNSSPAQSVR